MTCGGMPKICCDAADALSGFRDRLNIVDFQRNQKRAGERVVSEGQWQHPAAGWRLDPAELPVFIA